MKKLLLLFIPVLLFGGYERPGSTSGQFLKFGVSARAVGMAEAFLAVVDDASSVYYNPACLPLIFNKDISLTHTRWFANINHEFAGIATPFQRIGTFAISFVCLYTDAIEVTTPLQPDGTGETFYATNYALGVSYGRFLTDRTSIGLTARYIGLSLYHYNVSALSFDLGTLFRTDIRGFRFGMKISNFGPNLRFINEFYSLFNEKDYFELPLNAFKYNGGLYGLPISWTPLVLYYNKDIFDEAGVPYPDTTWDWNDFLSACKRCTKDTDGDGVADQFGYLLSTGWIFAFNWIWQNGGDILAPDGKRCVMNSKETIDALQFLADLRWKYKVSPTPEQIAQRDLFTTGKIAMIISGRWVVPRYRTIKDFRWGISHLPKGKVRATSIFTTAYVMSNKSTKRGNIWELAKFLSGKKGSRFIAELGLGVPSVKSVAYSSHFLNQEKAPENSEIYLETLSYARLGPRTVHWQEIGNIMETHLDELWFGKKNAKEVVDAIVEEVNRVLAEE